MTTDMTAKVKSVETSDSPNRMVRNKKKISQQLMDAALMLVSENGYQDVTMEQITEAADVGRRTIYNHFANKKDCVGKATKGLYKGYAQALKQNLSVDKQEPGRLIATMAIQMFQHIATDPVTEQLTQYPLILSEAIAESQRDYILANIADGISVSRFTPTLSIETLGPIMTWGFVGLVITSIERGSQLQDGPIWAQFLLQNLGINAEEAKQLIKESSSAA